MTAVIVDCDGTLVDVTGIRHYVVPSHPLYLGYKDYDRFHMASVWCPPIASTLADVAAYREAGHAILVMTARMRRWEAVTRGWLGAHGVRYDALYMRADGDVRPDAEVKRDLLLEARADGHEVVHALDDNPAIVELWRSCGIPVTVVPGWEG